ncbi:hypothetical protein BJ965_007729 [Streptomyces luteogriseus]|uniref:Uncharacterized protein n=1 Tax=Streptomyces luteogriseus TaxID=68233 RepID=A0A7W7DW93_9ACTN|nr:hypothetical protein [Streptomyces luteogriseus]
MGGPGRQSATQPVHAEGRATEGPAWYATPTVAYAVELGYEVRPIEAYVRYDNGRYLDGWYNGCATPISPRWPTSVCTPTWSRPTSWRRWTATRSVPPELAIVVSAVKATVKGGLGKLRERPRGEGWKPGQPWRRCPVRHGGRTSARRSSPAPGSTCTARSSSTRRPPGSTGRDPVRLRRLRGQRAVAAGLPALPGGQAAARRVQARHQPGPGQVGGPLRASCGARRSASGSTPPNSTSPVHQGRHRHRRRQRRIGEGDDEPVRDAPGSRGAQGVHPPSAQSAPAQMRYLVKQLKSTSGRPAAAHSPSAPSRRYVKDQIKKPRPDLGRPPEREVKARWQPQSAPRPSSGRPTTGGIVIDNPRPPRLHRAHRLDGPGTASGI